MLRPDATETHAAQLARLEVVLGDLGVQVAEPDLLTSRVARLLSIEDLPGRLNLETGSTRGSPMPVWDMHKMHDLAGFPDVWAFEKKYAET